MRNLACAQGVVIPLQREFFVGFFLLAAVLAAAGGTSSAARAELPVRCRPLEVSDAIEAVSPFPVIVVGTVREEEGGLAIVPEFYLRGAALPRPLRLVDDVPAECERAPMRPGARVLAGLEPAAGGWFWPAAGQVFVLEDGVASDGRRSLPEETLISTLRTATGQLAYPASEEDAGFDWRGTALPVGAALVVVFGVGLYLMRLWHRIDPT